VRYTKQKLALFFTVQVLGVAAMISLYEAALHPECNAFNQCTQPSGASICLAVALILGELVAVASVLRNHAPVWYALVGLGALSLIAGFVFGVMAFDNFAPHGLLIVMAIWHVVSGLVLLAAGTAASVWGMLEKLRRSDDSRPEDQQSLAMWPLD
jgi:hypothetical protein